MKKLVKILIGLVVLLVVALVVAFLFLGSIVKTGVETVGPKITDTDMKVASVDLSPMSGSGKIKQFILGNPKGCAAPNAVSVGEVRVAVDIKSLLSDTIVVKEVYVDAPEITFEGGPTDNNFTKIMANVDKNLGGGADKNAKPGEKPAPAQSGKKIKVGDLTIKGAKVSVTVAGVKAPTVVIPDIHLQNIGNDKDGITAAELTKVILSAVTKEVVKAATDVTGLAKSLGSDAGKQASGAVDKAGKTLKGLFGK